MTDWYDVAAGFESFEVIRVCLHHFSPLLQALSTVVCRADLVAFGVRKLQFDEVGVPALLV